MPALLLTVLGLGVASEAAAERLRLEADPRCPATVAQIERAVGAHLFDLGIAVSVAPDEPGALGVLAVRCEGARARISLSTRRTAPLVRELAIGSDPEAFVESLGAVVRGQLAAARRQAPPERAAAPLPPPASPPVPVRRPHRLALQLEYFGASSAVPGSWNHGIGGRVGFVHRSGFTAQLGAGWLSPAEADGRPTLSYSRAVGTALIGHRFALSESGWLQLATGVVVERVAWSAAAVPPGWSGRAGAGAIVAIAVELAGGLELSRHFGLVVTTRVEGRARGLSWSVEDGDGRRPVFRVAPVGVAVLGGVSVRFSLP